MNVPEVSACTLEAETPPTPAPVLFAAQVPGAGRGLRPLGTMLEELRAHPQELPFLTLKMVIIVTT